MTSVASFGVGSVEILGICSAAGSAAFSGVGSRVGILSNFFIQNNLLFFLKNFFSWELFLLHNPKLFKKRLFKNAFVLFSELFNSIAKLLWLRSVFSNDKCSSSIFL